MKKMALREQRNENILLSLKKLGYLTRTQIQVIHNLGGTRNAQRIMQELNEYVHSFRDGENIYYLSKKGRERVGCKKQRTKTSQTRHFIMRNDLYIAFGCPNDWKPEVKLKVEDEVSLICDALFTQDERYYIVEIDYMQKMSENKSKIQKYKRLMELGVFLSPPKFIWMTTTEHRRKELINLCIGLDTTIFTVADFH